MQTLDKMVNCTEIIYSIFKIMDSTENKDVFYTNELVSLGLSERDAHVYLYLLRRGASLGGTKIALGTTLHRQHIYLSLENLIERGLVEKVTHGKQFRYKAVSPKEIEKMARRKYLQAGMLADELLKESPVGHDQDFEVLVGEKAIRQHQMDFVREAEEGETQYIIGGSAPEFIDLMGDDYDEMLRIQAQKKFVTHYIGHRSEQSSLTPYQEESGINFYAKLLSEMPQGLPQFTVRRNTLEFYALSGTPQILYVIKSKHVADSYRAFFKMFWGMISETSTKSV
jgi:predicted transcriptional regulator